MTVHQILRPAGKIANGGLVGIDSHLMIERRQHLAEMNWAFNRFSAQAISRANHLPGAQAAAGHERAADLRPVIAAGVFVDDRRAAKFAGHQHQHPAV